MASDSTHFLGSQIGGATGHSSQSWQLQPQTQAHSQPQYPPLQAQFRPQSPQVRVTNRPSKPSMVVEALVSMAQPSKKRKTVTADLRSGAVEDKSWRRPINPARVIPKPRDSEIIVISDDEGGPAPTPNIQQWNYQTPSTQAPMTHASRLQPSGYVAQTSGTQANSTASFSQSQGSSSSRISPSSSVSQTEATQAAILSASSFPASYNTPQYLSPPSGALTYSTPANSHASQSQAPTMPRQQGAFQVALPMKTKPINVRKESLGNRANHEGLHDHRGCPLSEDAINAARAYWDCQREYDQSPFGADHIEGPQPYDDPLLGLARARRTYTQLILGLDGLEPGTRTYEPPYIEPKKESVSPINTGENTEAATEAAGALPDSLARTEPVLCPEQAAIVELAASGRNIFYTGSAGCGKSTVLHAIRKRLESMGKRVKVMAPTGKVALAINGTTTWTFAGWNPDSNKKPIEELENMARSRRTRRRFRDTDVIIIDEISMVENMHFERLNAIMKVGRFDQEAYLRTGLNARIMPFGGVQVIVTGDFCQLPPVRPFEYCMQCGKEFTIKMDNGERNYYCSKCRLTYNDGDKWAFRSRAWQECDFVNFYLQTIHRQNDNKFISMLQKCRMGVPFNHDEVDILMNHKSITTNAVKLFSTREEVRKINEENFMRLKTEAHPYQCLDRFIWNKLKHPALEYKNRRNADNSLAALNEHRFERYAELKVGMLVVLLVNLDLPSGLCNGSQGIIAGFEDYDPTKLPRKGGPDSDANSIMGTYCNIKEEQIRAFAEKNRRGLAWPIIKFLNGVTRVIYPECQVHELGDEKEYSLMCRTQVPLTAAWALSIHKAQGMTLDRVVVNLSRAFEEGQVYVALSRATSLEGLRVEGDPKGLKVGAGGNKDVALFLRQKFGLV